MTGEDQNKRERIDSFFVLVFYYFFPLRRKVTCFIHSLPNFFINFLLPISLFRRLLLLRMSISLSRFITIPLLLMMITRVAVLLILACSHSASFFFFFFSRLLPSLYVDVVSAPPILCCCFVRVDVECLPFH